MRALVAVALAAALTSAPAMAQTRCLTETDAESIALVAMPDIVRGAGIVCAARLPAASLVRQTGGPFLDKYQAAADRAWPGARAAIVKLSDPAIDLLLGSDYARPLLTAALAPLLVGRIAPKDCGTIDHLLTLLAPLPPQNMAGVIVTTLHYLKTEKAKGKNVAVPDLPLCAEEPR
jgi:hypothetical protein